MFYTDDIDGGGINIIHRSKNFSITLNSDTERGRLDIYNSETEEPVGTLAVSAAGGRLEIRDNEGTLLSSLP